MKRLELRLGRAGTLLLLSLPVHLALALVTDLSPDEAYYLCAARLSGIAPGLVDHPPLLPWLLRLSDALAPLPVELRVRIWPILLSLLLGYLLLVLARQRNAPEEGQTRAMLLGQWTILPMAAGFVATPDTLLLPAFAALLAWAADSKSPPFGLRWLMAMGAALLGALAKVVMLPLGLAIALMATPRPTLERLGTIAAMACSLPVLWPSLNFQLRHAFIAETVPGSFASAVLSGVRAMSEAALVQALLWTPWAFAYGLRAFRSLPLPDRAAFLSLSALVLLSALVRGRAPEANWWAPAALVLIVACSMAEHRKKPLKQGDYALFAAVLLPTSIALLHTAHPFLPLPPHADPTARLHGWSHGIETPNAAGVGVYGPAAERCVYFNHCDEIINYFNELNNKPSSPF